MLIAKWAYNWKVFFKPAPSKPAQEVLFLRKKKFQIQIHVTTGLNNIQVEKVPYQKHLVILLDENFIFKPFRWCYLENKQRHIYNKKTQI